MAYSEIKNVEIKGIAACVPDRVEKNRDFPLLSQEMIEKYIDQVGVVERHCAIHDGSVCTSDLCYEAADKLLNELGWDRSEIGLLVFVSHSQDYKLPATACILQDRLGLSKETMAFDVPLGCSGYVYGLGIAGNILAMGLSRKPYCLWVTLSRFMQVHLINQQHYFLEMRDLQSLLNSIQTQHRCFFIILQTGLVLKH